MNMNKIWLVAILALGFMTSCNDDDDSDKVNDGNFIVTSQPLYIDLTSAVLTGEFYPDRIPSAYGTQYTPLSLGIELSLTEEFSVGNVYPVYAQGIQGNQMEVTLNGLSPDTEYFYRAFIDMGTMKLYGEKLSFKTSALQLACNVDDPTDISFTTASFTIRSNEVASALLSEGFIFGVAYSTNKDLFSKTINNVNDWTGIEFLNIGYTSQPVTITANNLESGQTYYYCAYTASKDYRICQFGPVKSFKTESMDGLLAIDAINAKFVVAEVTGHTTFPKSTKGIQYVFNYSQIDVNYAIRNEVTMNVDGNNLTAVVKYLNPCHRYECWISVVQDGSTIVQSNKKEFETQNPGDYILLDDATDITANSAVVNCTLSPYAFEEPQSIAFVYFGQDKNNLIRMTSARLNGDHLTAELTDLQPNTTYYYCAQALCTLSFGWADWFYSEIKSFTTLPE